MEKLNSDEIEIYQNQDEESEYPRPETQTSATSSDCYDSFHDSGSFSADYARQSPVYGNSYATGTSSFGNDYATLQSTSALDPNGSQNVDTKDLRKVVQQQTQHLDPDTANLLSLMCVALEKANDERNNFEQMLRQRHLENINQISDINQEVEEQIGQERERLDRDFKERQEQMRDVVQSEMKELQSRLDLLESENAQLKCNLQEVDKAKNDLTDEYEDLKRDNRYLEESLSMTKDELNLSKSVANSIRAEQIEELKEREKTIEEFAKEAEEDRSALLDRIEELEREKTRLKDERDDLESFKTYWIQNGPNRTDPLTEDELYYAGGENDQTLQGELFSHGKTGVRRRILLPTSSHSGFGEDDLWTLDPKSRPAVDSSDDSEAQSIISSSVEGNLTRSRSRSRGQSSSISLVSINDIDKTVQEHIREAESSTNLYSTANQEKVFKIVFLGDTCVGKTSFIQRFHSDYFQEKLPSTVGIDFLLKSISVHGQQCTLQLWDTCGQEKFRALTRNYFRKADGVILMYDVTRPQSFYSLKTWMEDVYGFAPGDVCLMIVGNKADLSPGPDCQVELDADLVKTTLGSQTDFSFTEVSSRNGQNVTQCMTQFTSRLIHREEDRMTFPESKLKKNFRQSIADFEREKKKKCCEKL
ncbi:uncharacterized protein LOC142354749 isoform X1 [Convolutriloba macropyga]|uniref:uncharacterized protein LOC142354749 isoform X1 n=1 Tax=Convolutriloba macropyga TaxID=536237 RepID=UPI003F522C17